METKILQFPGTTTGRVPPESVVNGLLEALPDTDELFVVRVDKQGERSYYSTGLGGGPLLWELELFKQRLLSGEFGEDK